MITGATSGFGFALVESFLKNDDFVIATGRKINERSALFTDLTSKHPTKLKLIDLDVTEQSSRSAALVELADQDVDILINNAGLGHFGALEDSTEDSLREVFEVNFFGLVLLTRTLLPKLRESKGHIINLSSMLGFAGLPLASVYSASKFAVEGFSESLAHELAPHGVKVSIIEPGGYRTKFAINSLWESSKDSAYSVQSSGMKSFMSEMQSKQSYQRPEDLAAGIVHISKSNKPKISYTFGKDSGFSKMLSKLTSRQIYFNLTNKFYRKKLWSDFVK